MASPPRLIVLIVSPRACITRMATNNESGSATNEMTVVRKFIRKKNSTTITNSAPSNSACCILWIELLIKRDWRKISVEIRTSAGSVFCKSCMEASSLSVNSRVLVAGCLVTVTNTAGFAFSEASPNLGALLPIRMSAISESMTGISLTVLTTAFPNSSVWVVAITPCTMYSLPYS